MNIIPVIDLKDAHVVSAKQGQRETYQALNCPLFPSSSLTACIQAFLDIYAFNTIYIADLNAITNAGNNQTLIDSVIKNYPAIEFWIDNGIPMQQMSEFTDVHYKPIIASESQNNTQLKGLDSALSHSILSLDFFPVTGFAGPVELLNNSRFWPENIIIMSLERVGKNTGPDFAKLENFVQQYPDKTFIAAGGIRHQQDLIQLKNIGINHALIASALHSGVIDSKTIANLCL